MSASVTILYPRKDGSKFDSDYYLTKHMPLVKKLWTSHGLKSYHVVKFEEGPYLYGCLMDWESVDAFKGATQHETAKEIMGDISNYSTEQPVILGGEVLGSG